MSDLLSKVSDLPFAFGGAAISGEGAGYGFGDIGQEDAISLLNYAYDRGYRVFDTAPIYGFGLSEKRMGQAFKNKREEVFIISKSGVTWHDNMRVDMTNRPDVTQKMLEQSLRDLGSDYIDLYMIHWPDKNVDIRRPLEVLAKAKSQGKIRHIGLCNTFKADLEKAREVEKIEVVQSELNFFSRDVLNEVIPLAHEQNMSFMSWGTLDKGILTNRVNRKRKYDKNDCRSWAPWWKAMDKESRYKSMEIINPILEKYGHTGLELAISFNLSFDGVSSLLCGTRSHSQIDSLLSAYENRIDPQIILEIEKALDVH